MEAYHVKTYQMYDMNEITYNQEQITVRVPQKDWYEQLEIKV